MTQRIVMMASTGRTTAATIPISPRRWHGRGGGGQIRIRRGHIISNALWFWWLMCLSLLHSCVERVQLVIITRALTECCGSLLHRPKVQECLPVYRPPQRPTLTPTPLFFVRRWATGWLFASLCFCVPSL